LSLSALIPAIPDTPLDKFECVIVIAALFEDRFWNWMCDGGGNELRRQMQKDEFGPTKVELDTDYE